MSMTYKEEELCLIRKAAQTLSRVHDATYLYIQQILRQGQKSINLTELDRAIANLISIEGADPVLFGYPDFQNPKKTYNFTCCVSQADALVHGVPSGTLDFFTSEDLALFRNANIVNQDFYPSRLGMIPPLPPFTIDIALKTKAGWCADLARSYLPIDASCLTEGAEEALELIVINSEGYKMLLALKECLANLTNKLDASWTLMDIGVFIRDHARRYGYTVPVQYGGHGIGRELHMDPHVPCTWAAGWPNEKLKPGMVLCIEPMFIKAKSDKLEVDPNDGWTVKLADEHGVCAHQEIMVEIYEKGCRVIGV